MERVEERNAALRLEQAIRLYEDIAFLQGAHNQVDRMLRRPVIFRSDLAVANWSNLRPTILTIRPNMTDLEIYQTMDPFRFPVRPQSKGSIINRENFLDMIPLVTALWTRDSRRVFHISEDLQLLLDATSLEGITLQDVKFPFNCFLISLARPISGILRPEGVEVAFDTMLVTNTQEPNRVTFWIITGENDRFKFLTATQRREIQKYLGRGKAKRAKVLIDRHLEDFSWCTGSSFNVNGKMKSTPVTEVVDAMNRTDGEFGDKAIRIIVGMCLYLKSLPPASPHVSLWTPVHRNLSGDRYEGVTDASHICHVSTQFKLTSGERKIFVDHTDEVMRTGYRQKVPHFRCGFWGRPKGLGHDPNALKTVWTRPTIVNDHLLKPGELPRGADTVLLKK